MRGSKTLCALKELHCRRVRFDRERRRFGSRNARPSIVLG